MFPGPSSNDLDSQQYIANAERIYSTAMLMIEKTTETLFQKPDFPVNSTGILLYQDMDFSM